MLATTLLVNTFSVRCNPCPFIFFDFERERYFNRFLLEDLVVFFLCLDLELLLDGTLEDNLLVFALSDDDAVEGNDNSFRELLLILLFTFCVQPLVIVDMSSSDEFVNKCSACMLF